MGGADLLTRRRLLRAELLRMGATRVERAARWPVARIGNLAGDRGQVAVQVHARARREQVVAALQRAKPDLIVVSSSRWVHPVNAGDASAQAQADAMDQADAAPARINAPVVESSLDAERGVSRLRLSLDLLRLGGIASDGLTVAGAGPPRSCPESSSSPSPP